MSDHVRAMRDELRAARLRAGLSIEEVADRASQHAPDVLTYLDVYRLESRYRHMPPADILRPVAFVLDVDLEDVFRRCGYF